jgi:hypothetical protein
MGGLLLRPLSGLAIFIIVRASVEAVEMEATQDVTAGYRPEFNHHICCQLKRRRQISGCGAQTALRSDVAGAA